MKFLLLVTLLFTTTTFAGVVGRDRAAATNTYKGVFSEVLCEKGVDCSKSGEKLLLKLNQVKTIATWSSGDATPSVANYTFFNTYAASQTVTALDDGETGQEVLVLSTAGITYDVTGTTLKCGTTDVITASGDLTRWIYDGTNWRCTARVKASGNMN